MKLKKCLYSIINSKMILVFDDGSKREYTDVPKTEYEKIINKGKEISNDILIALDSKYRNLNS